MSLYLPDDVDIEKPDGRILKFVSARLRVPVVEAMSESGAVEADDVVVKITNRGTKERYLVVEARLTPPEEHEPPIYRLRVVPLS